MSCFSSVTVFFWLCSAPSISCVHLLFTNHLLYLLSLIFSDSFTTSPTSHLHSHNLTMKLCFQFLFNSSGEQWKTQFIPINHHLSFPLREGETLSCRLPLAVSTCSICTVFIFISVTLTHLSFHHVYSRSFQRTQPALVSRLIMPPGSTPHW